MILIGILLMELVAFALGFVSCFVLVYSTATRTKEGWLFIKDRSEQKERKTT